MAVMAREKTKKDSGKRNRSGVNLNLYVDEDIRTALDQYMAGHNAAAEHPATLRSSVEAALKLFLKEKGFWPPKPT